mgnify:FL=1
MFYNITDNAIRYTPDGGDVKVFVGKLNGKPYFRVEDNGIGIPESEQQRIFERFYRVDKSHSRETGGTGLGLSIVKHGAVCIMQRFFWTVSRVRERRWKSCLIKLSKAPVKQLFGVVKRMILSGVEKRVDSIRHGC